MIKTTSSLCDSETQQFQHSGNQLTIPVRNKNHPSSEENLVLNFLYPSSGEFKVFFSVKNSKVKFLLPTLVHRNGTFYLISVHMELYYLVQKKGKMDTSSNNSSEGGAMVTTHKNSTTVISVNQIPGPIKESLLPGENAGSGSHLFLLPVLNLTVTRGTIHQAFVGTISLMYPDNKL